MNTRCQRCDGTKKANHTATCQVEKGRRVKLVWQASKSKRWYVDWTEDNGDTFTTGGGVGFATQAEAEAWNPNPKSKRAHEVIYLHI